MVYVLDASFCAPHFLPDEKNESTGRFFASVGEDDTMYVPQLWWYEMGNILKKALMRKRIEYSAALELASGLASFNVITDTESGGAYAHALLKLAHDYDLTTYDAAYLELAGRKKAVLGTLDGNLKTAADKFGVKAL
jgi:predicted nucleic acid-binding protein